MATGLRQLLRPEYAEGSEPHLNAMLDATLSPLPDEAAAAVIGSLQTIGKTAMGTLGRVGPDAAKGAAAGSVAGPWGALLGAGVGVARSLASQPKRTAVAAGEPRRAGIPERPTAALPSGSDAAAALLALFDNPTVRQALASQVLGTRGVQHVRTASGASLPRAAINDLLTQLLGSATDGLPERDYIDEESYLFDDSAENHWDPASAEERALAVLRHVEGPRAAFAAFSQADSDSHRDEPFPWETMELEDSVEFF